jgi:hypothetical protein
MSNRRQTKDEQEHKIATRVLGVSIKKRQVNRLLSYGV